MYSFDVFVSMSIAIRYMSKVLMYQFFLVLLSPEQERIHLIIQSYLYGVHRLRSAETQMQIKFNLILNFLQI
ncbi:hypothetical protein CMK18_12430 [Candidatus Poribacteria bacterium]|nr:hypothetical protein [Candidatus Poribacteria bacterium]